MAGHGHLGGRPGGVGGRGNIPSPYDRYSVCICLRIGRDTGTESYGIKERTEDTLTTHQHTQTWTAGRPRRPAPRVYNASCYYRITKCWSFSLFSQSASAPRLAPHPSDMHFLARCHRCKDKASVLLYLSCGGVDSSDHGPSMRTGPFLGRMLAC